MSVYVYVSIHMCVYDQVTDKNLLSRKLHLKHPTSYNCKVQQLNWRASHLYKDVGVCT